MIRIYGLTGGTGSGKSTAAQRFAQVGIPVLDADEIGHRLIEPDGGAFQQVIDEFGPEILVEGRIDRGKLGRRIFADSQARKRLNEIVHPLIHQVVARRCAELHHEGHRVLVIDAALLGEDGQREPWLDGLILIIAPRDVRVDRLVAHRNISREEAQRRIDAQTPPESKAALADWIVENTGNLDEFCARIDAIAGEINAE